MNRHDSNGNPCYGYMDYNDDTNGWSTCSVEDFTRTDKSCLQTANYGTFNPGEQSIIQIEFTTIKDKYELRFAIYDDAIYNLQTGPVKTTPCMPITVENLTGLVMIIGSLGSEISV